jgi:hypothetical protein
MPYGLAGDVRREGTAEERRICNDGEHALMSALHVIAGQDRLRAGDKLTVERHKRSTLIERGLAQSRHGAPTPLPGAALPNGERDAGDRHAAAPERPHGRVTGAALQGGMESPRHKAACRNLRHFVFPRSYQLDFPGICDALLVGAAGFEPPTSH